MRSAATTLLVALLAAAVQLASAQSSAQDFYFVVDRSGSIRGKDAQCARDTGLSTCMEVIADFANKTANRLAELVGSYYESPENNGVRIGIVMFRCTNAPDVLMPPTGDRATIAQGFEDLSELVANAAGTCAKSALVKVEGWVDAKTALEPPTRTTSVIFVTDGALNRNDRNPARSAAERLRADENTQIFGISIGGATEARKEDIARITGSTNRVFDVAGASSLDNIIDSLSAFIFGDFRAALVPPDSGASSFCAGDTPTLRITGKSVAALSEVECEFSAQGVAGPAVTPGLPLSAGFGFDCALPASFAAGPEEALTVSIVSVESDGNRRTLVTDAPIAVPRSVCLQAALADSGTRCLGSGSQVRVTGATARAARAAGVGLQCRLSLSGGGDAVAVVAGATDGEDAYVCDVADADVVWQGADAGLATVREIIALQSVTLAAAAPATTVPGTGGATLQLALAGAALPARLDLAGSACAAGGPPASACWRDPSSARAEFAGPALAWALQQPGASVQCIMNMSDGADAFTVSTVAATPDGDDGVACALPPAAFEPSETAVDGAAAAPRQLQVTPVLVRAGSPARRLALAGPARTAQLALGACVALTQDREPCFGEGVSVVLASPHADFAADASVGCSFLDANNGIVLQGTVGAGAGPDEFVCTTPDTNADACPLTLSHLILTSNARAVLFHPLLDTDASACFETRAGALGPDDALTAQPALEACFAQPSGALAVAFGGETGRSLRGASVACVFRGGLPVTGDLAGLGPVPARFSEAQQALVCELPAEAFRGAAVGQTASDLAVDLVYSCADTEGGRDEEVRRESVLETVAVPPLTVRACVEAAARSAVGGEFSSPPRVDACWAAAAAGQVLFAGETARALGAAAGDVSCAFALGGGGFETAAASFDAAQGGHVCALPAALARAEAGLDVNGLEVRYVVGSGDGLVLLAAPVAVRVRTGAPCFGALRLEAEPAQTCVGAALFAATEGGASLEALLASAAGSGVTAKVGSDAARACVVAQEPAALRCPLPRRASLPGAQTTVTLRAVNGAGTVQLPVLSGPATQRVCIETAVSVAEQQAPGSRRALQGSGGSQYCMGDALSTGFTGGSLALLLAEFDSLADDWACQWAPASAGVGASTTPVLAAAGALRCDAPVWDPFTAAGAAQGAYATVQLSVRNASLGTALDLAGAGFAAQVCSDGPAWPAGLSDADADCARGSVELALQGRSAFTLARQPQRVACAFSGPSGNATAAPEFELQATPPAVRCTGPGWRPGAAGAGSGNYTEVRLEVDGAAVKSQSFAPTAARQCLALSGSDGVCFGAPVAPQLQGATVSAIEAWAAETLGQTLLAAAVCSLNGADAAAVAAADGGVSCLVSGQLLASAEAYSLGLRVGELQVMPVEGRSTPARSDDPGCLRAIESLANCSAAAPSAQVQLAGATVLALQGAQLGLLQCVLSRDGAESVTAPLVPVNGSGGEAVQCGVAGEAMRRFAVTPVADATAELASGPITPDTVTCAQVIGGGGGDDGGLGGGAVAGIVIGLLLLILLLLMLLLARRRRKEEAERRRREALKLKKDAGEDLEAGEVDSPTKQSHSDSGGSSAELLDVKPGDRVEALLTPKGAAPEEDQEEEEGGSNELGGARWFRGTVLELMRDGRVLVDLDAAPAAAARLPSTEVAVPARALQLARSDFSEGDRVEARFGAQEGNWQGARVTAVRANNAYDVAYDDEALAEEKMVSGALLRAPVMLFRRGDAVEVRGGDDDASATWRRGSVDAVDVAAESYTIGGGESVPAARVRAFLPQVGEVVDARLDGKPAERRTVESVDAEAQMVGLDGGARAPFSAISRPVFAHGDRVEVRNKLGLWQPGTVSAVNDDDKTLDVDLDTGVAESRVPLDRLRRVEQQDAEQQGAGGDEEGAFRPPPRDHGELLGADGKPVPYHLRFRKRKPLAYQELPGNQFDLTVDMSEGLGLSLGWTNDSRVIVAGFRDLPSSGTWGPVEATGLVGLKDELIQVNEEPVTGKSFVEVSELIRKSQAIIKLRFGRWDDVQGPVSMHMAQT